MKEDDKFETIFENDLFKGFKLKEENKDDGLDAWITVNDGEMLYYIGVWNKVRIISKIDIKRKNITLAFVRNSDNFGTRIEMDRMEFLDFLNSVIENFGEPTTVKSYIHLKNQDEVNEEIEKGVM